MKPRTMLTVALLAVVAASVVALIVKEFAAPPSSTAGFQPPPTGTIVYYFHSAARCAACQRVEDLSRATVETDFAQLRRDDRLRFAAINYEAPGDAHFIKDFDLPGNSLLVAEYRGGRAVRYKLLPEVWALNENRERFAAYVQAEVTAFLAEAK